MEYNYYKDKYKSYTIKLDRVKDRKYIDFLDRCSSVPQLLRTIIDCYESEVNRNETIHTGNDR